MLICVAELLESSDLEGIRARFPAVENCFEGPLQHAVAHNTDELSHHMNISSDDNTSQDFIEALLSALDIAETRNPTRFAQLTHRAFGNHICQINNVHGMIENNLFVDGALDAVHAWRPKAWSIPTDSELSRMEGLVCQSEKDKTLIYDWCYVESPLRLKNSRYYFSAAAVAIDFCK